MAFASVTTAKKLYPYFQTHMIKVFIEASLAKVFRKPDSTERLIRLVVELSKFDLLYEPNKTIKGQALANFVVEFEWFPQEEVAAPTRKP